MATLGLTTEEQKAIDAFRTDVVTPSMDKLVILDFWADWCGPCKQLTPVLEKVAADYADRGVLLAKIDVDANKFIAAQFQVRSIPTVYAIYQGQPVADLTPARTEAQITQMLDQLLAKLPIESSARDPLADIGPMIGAAEDLLGHDGAEQAYGLFVEVLALLPDHPPAVSGLIRSLSAMGRGEEAQIIFDSASDEVRAHPSMEKARSVLTITTAAVAPDALDAMRAEVEANPEDHGSRIALATALMAAGERDAAVEQLLHSIAADREWNEGAAKKQLLDIFTMIGLEDPWVAANRRKLSAILFG